MKDVIQRYVPLENGWSHHSLKDLLPKEPLQTEAGHHSEVVRSKHSRGREVQSGRGLLQRPWGTPLRSIGTPVPPSRGVCVNHHPSAPFSLAVAFSDAPSSKLSAPENCPDPDW